jgi:hypothetical protein
MPSLASALRVQGWASCAAQSVKAEAGSVAAALSDSDRGAACPLHAIASYGEGCAEAAV